MDEAVGEEVAPNDAVDGRHRQNKEIEYFSRCENRDMLELQDMRIHGEGNYSQSTTQAFVDILEGKDVNMDALEHPCASLRTMDDADDIVEELTVRNYNSSNLAIVGTSNNRDRARMNKLKPLFLPAGGLGSGNSGGSNRDNGKAISSAREDVGYVSSPDFLAQKAASDDHNKVVEELTNTSNNGAVGGIRTKILSKSGFSDFFIKNTLKGKGIMCRGPPRDTFHVESRDQSRTKAAGMVTCDPSLLGAKTAKPSSHDTTGPRPGGSDCDGFSLREWLKAGLNKANKVESLYVFRQIVDLVDYSHSQGVALRDLRPSFLELFPSNQVKYIGTSIQRDMLECVMDRDVPWSESSLFKKRTLDQEMISSVGLSVKKKKLTENMKPIQLWPQFRSRSGVKLEAANDCVMNATRLQDSGNKIDEHIVDTDYMTQSKSSGPHASHRDQELLASLSNQLEEKWYTSPEELSERDCTVSSNIYCLGVLLFELLGHFDSERAHAAAMLDLRHRILPSKFLSENPREARFCLLLLHPEPPSRPTTREILQSEVISGLRDVCAEELSSSIEQDDTESELLSHFLISLEEQKQKRASKLVEDIRCLEADIKEIERRSLSKKSLVHSSSHNYSFSEKENNFFHEASSSLEDPSQLPPTSNTNQSRLMSYASQLESAYFAVRSKIQFPETYASIRADKDLLKSRQNWCLARKNEEKQSPTDRLGDFFDGLCKYARYSKFEVRGILRTADFSNFSNVICSLSFDRDGDYFAAAGVSKKIKIFEFNALFNDSVDIHYPAIEMSNRSNLSCICWNNYVRNYLASADHDGVVKIWDVSTGQAISCYTEHQKRAWSVDFSPVDPTKLASGSDDCSVKLWNINEKNCLGTIRNIANVCCVQFSAHSTHLLAFGSADYRTYCYDLRNVKTPWCVLAGHDKAVSYVKFLDSETLVSASTDNTLKLWDLNKSSPTSLSSNACSSTLRGHTNEKNFVGLSVGDGYIACGSETNEVYAYYRSLPMPITSHKFTSIDPISGKEIDDDPGQFVSSVCWRGKSDMVVAANSRGCIRVLQIV